MQGCIVKFILVKKKEKKDRNDLFYMCILGRTTQITKLSARTDKFKDTEIRSTYKTMQLAEFCC